MNISVDTTILIQDVQLLCFTVVFAILAWQRWHDPMRRWLLLSFLANDVGAVIDLFPAHLPSLITHGVEPITFPLSYALLNVAFVRFERRGRLAEWLSLIVLIPALPFFVAWSSDPNSVMSNSLGDLTIALECTITPAILLLGKERSTCAPRFIMGSFLIAFAVLEYTRAWVAFGLHANPDKSFQSLVLVSAVTYIVNVSLLPLAVVWMMNARLEAELQQQIIIDPLTAVYNRRGFEPAFHREVSRYQRYREDLTVVIMDLDHFKQLNDAYGHATGDSVLKEVAELLSSGLREADVLARLGGEEFVILLPHTTLTGALPIVERLCDEMREKRYPVAGASVRVTASWGLTNTCGRMEADGRELLREADHALYAAKNNGRDQVCVFECEDSEEVIQLPERRLRAI
jgi:diguanylate cyclase (GGDEF)-like protein